MNQGVKCETGLPCIAADVTDMRTPMYTNKCTFNLLKVHLDVVMDKWTNPQIHYSPENGFFHYCTNGLSHGGLVQLCTEES